MSWLDQALGECILTEGIEEYLLGRGAKPSTIEHTGFRTWRPTSFDIPDPIFARRYGSRGHGLRGHLATPLYSPRGSIIGVEYREVLTKNLNRYLLPAAYWNPVWIGPRDATAKLWAGGGVWIVEGLFDVLPLEWVIRETDTVLGCITAKMSAKHVAYLKRMNPKFINICFDNDPTGRKGILGYIDKDGRQVWGAAKALDRAGLGYRVYPYGRGRYKDPGEIWDRGGVNAMREEFGR